MVQMVIRISKDSNLVQFNVYLKEGWFVVMGNPLGDYIEYILQKGNK